MSIVGDAFAKPILRALDAEPDRWDISSLRVIVSCGVMWSTETKAGPAAPQRPADHGRLARLVARRIGMASSTTTADGAAAARRRSSLGPNDPGVTDDGRDVVSGLGRARPRGDARAHAGRLLQGPGEVGGHVRRASTACATRSPATAPRSTPTAPCACSAAGSQCINTGGEKVYPEEVEEVLKLHPTRRRRGRRRRARRALRRGDHRRSSSRTPATPSTRRRSIAHVKAHLAGYKAPKRVITVDTVGRARQRQARLPAPLQGACAARSTGLSRPRRRSPLPSCGHG